MTSQDKFSWWDVFITEYLKNGQNGTQAFLKARPNVTKRSAETSAERLLRNVEFRKRLDAARSKVEKKLEMSREKWIQNLVDVAQVDLKDFLSDDDGDIDLAKDWKKRADVHAIEAIYAKTTKLESGQVVRTVQIKKENKIKALELIGKALGYLTDKVEVSGSIGLAQRIIEARKRANVERD